MPYYNYNSRGCSRVSYPLLVAAIIVFASNLGDGLCHHDEKAALLRLKRGFRFDHALSELSSWQASSASDCCTWQGVTCGDAGGTQGLQVVVSLDLADLAISGNLSSDLFVLTSLRFLSLANNDFIGIPLPSSGFERLSSLTYLNLSYCGFVGQVPSGIARLPNLETLHLSGAFTWDTAQDRAIPFLELKEHTLDTLITNLSSLQRLYLDYVNVYVANADANRSSKHFLRELRLSNCWVTGPIATSLIPKLRSLSELVLDYCTFSHPMATSFSGFDKLSSLLVLSLRYSGLLGTFPSSRIFSIKTLKVIDLSGNTMLRGELPEFMPGSALQSLALTGTMFSRNIPKSITNLHNLITLDLSSCLFNGDVPSFAQWTMIQEVDLSNNNLVGSLPSDGYSALHNLTRINLRNNSLSGEIPANLFSHPCLLELDLVQNNFTGHLLLHPNASSRLQNLFLGENNLQGPIPELLSKLSGLTKLDLSSNNLTGTMDISLIKNLTNLYLLQLSSNRLSIVEKSDARSYVGYPNILSLGLASCNLTKLPAFLMYLNEVESLDLSDNSIAGPIPDWIWRAGANDFYYVNLSHNSFTSIQGVILAPAYLILDLHSNMIEGSLPVPPLNTSFMDCSRNHFTHSITSEFLSGLTYAGFMSLSNNMLTGEVPPMICNTSNLKVLDLSFNSLGGTIPPCMLQETRSISVLNLRGNNFRGSLPQNISRECALETINLNDNNLEGKLPESLVNCKMLQVLDVGDNQMVDTFPDWLGGLPELRVLALRSNRFHGPITIVDGTNFFPVLQVFDISSNNFNGGIPAQYLKRLKAMISSSEVESKARTIGYQYAIDIYYEDSVTVMLKGLDVTFVRILSTFKSLDVSNNSFDGTMPSEIGDLKLLKVLNLSRNAFSGGIPSQISSMVELESLDLSHNHLSGEIPSSMASLTFLEVLDLSYNHLFGPVPQSGQFLTFPSTSYAGNDRLCGSPLSRRCDEPESSTRDDCDCDNDSANWDVLSVELGIACGLAAVTGYLLFSSRGRRWFTTHIDSLLLHVQLSTIASD
ncbi:unnamed protein product [Urochloa decumbens]|uniref:Leucine-rich repeat-containing N-terminal plant-type domain-containing protein n=1 Tax=Urochloa decumbens TaxID=240449 RepID=A0ABC8Z312_9POAL